MSIGSCKIEWCNNIRILVVYIVSGKQLSFDVDQLNVHFMLHVTISFISLTMEETLGQGKIILMHLWCG